MGALTDRGRKLGWSGLLPVRQRREAKSFTYLHKAGPRGQVRQCPAGCRVHVRGQGRKGNWELPAGPRLGSTGSCLPWREAGEKALRLSPASALTARVLVPRAPPPGSRQG